jgi:hypothetical protein
MKRQLDAAADRSGRSQSQEAEIRLERSFDRQELLPEVLTNKFSKKTAGILLCLAYGMEVAGQLQLLEDDEAEMNIVAGHKHWTDDPTATFGALMVAQLIIGALQQRMPDRKTPMADWPQVAWSLMEAVSDGKRPGSDADLFKELADTVKPLLGPICDRFGEFVAKRHETSDIASGGSDLPSVRTLIEEAQQRARLHRKRRSGS